MIGPFTIGDIMVLGIIGGTVLVHVFITSLWFAMHDKRLSALEMKERCRYQNNAPPK